MKIYSIKKNINSTELISNFLSIKNWENKYKYIIELSDLLIKMPKYMKNKNNIIHDCQSQVWCNVVFRNKKIMLYGYSDSLMIKGLISIIFIFFNNSLIKNINDLDFKDFIKNFDFIENFSINKSYGIFSIEKYIKNKIYIISKNFI